ncbi:MAG: hypothetical protein LBP81_07810 [Treponema sp.]|jgi:hypothetical protein|nr:hypothetical protein [Treponema sp.]
MDKSGKQQNHCAFRTEFLKKPAAFFAVVLGLLLLAACGIEEYPYLEPVRESNISWELNTQATILLPYVSSQQFTHFAIYYRIYVSDVPIVSTISDTNTMNTINSTLAQDYNTFLPYINTDNTSVSTQIDTLFSNRKYYSLYTESPLDLNNLLSSSAMGQRIVIDFSQGNGRPTIEIGGAEYVLWRTTGRERLGEVFEIKPNDRSFLNTGELNSSVSTSSAPVNTDVADKAVSGSRYTYVSMYIVSAGQNLTDYRPFYSQPAYIGVFLLPDP